MSEPPPALPIELFYSYSHRDEKLRDRLEAHLTLLKRQGLITGWHYRKIAAGQEWANQIDEHLDSAQIILLLVSADFLASEYCYDVELTRAMERQEAGEACVIPIILRPCDWHSAPFGKLQALPKNAKPITDWPRRDAALVDVAQGIRRIAEEMADRSKSQQLHLPSASGMASSAEVTSNPSTRCVDYVMQSTQIDFVFITALEVECHAVCAAFSLTNDQRERRDSRVYWRGRLPLKDGEFYEIAVAQSPDMANIDAALLTLDALHHWKPGAAIMVGLAAAANEEQHLGDIIVGSDVYYYERGKVKQEGVKPEPKMYPADATLWNNVNALPNWTTDILAARPDGTANRPTVRKGVIASGEKVIAYEASRDQIASGHRKIRAIEMEGYGFSAAVWQSFHQVRHLVIRGICDLADLSKNDEWHSYAAAAVASFAKHFLLDRPIEPRNILRSRDSLTQP